MFSAQLERMFRCYEEQSRIYRQMAADLEDLQGSRRRLSDRTPMAEAEGALKGACIRLQEQVLQLGQLLAAMERIIESYQYFENKVAEFSETAFPQRKPYEIGYMDYEPIRKEMQDFKLM